MSFHRWHKMRHYSRTKWGLFKTRAVHCELIPNNCGERRMLPASKLVDQMWWWWWSDLVWWWWWSWRWSWWCNFIWFCFKGQCWETTSRQGRGVVGKGGLISHSMQQGGRQAGKKCPLFLRRARVCFFAAKNVVFVRNTKIAKKT